MTESRLQRWARKKAEVRQDKKPTAPAPAPDIETGPVVDTAPEVSTVEQELTVNESLSEQELLAKYNLPNPDALEQGTDITGFLREEIPEFLRRKALRSLWRSNPIFAILDGLNEYDEDFSKVTTPLGGVKTAYKVGKGGFLDLEKRERERQAAALEEATDDTVRLSESEPAASEAQEQRREEELRREEEEREAELQAEELLAGTSESDFEGQTELAEPEPEPQPRFRPRMQFER